MLADPDIDVVHDCTPNNAHFLINKDIILAGKHVLSEKPLTTESRESAELVELARTRGVLTAVNFVYRHFPVLRHLRGMIEGGELGEIFAATGAYFQDWLLRDTDYDWRVEARLGGPSRAMADIGSHWCDLAQFLLGQDITQVCADLATFIPFRAKPASSETASTERPAGGKVRVDTEDYGSVLLRFSGGARGAFSVSQAGAGRKIGLGIEIHGSKASARWDFENAGRLWIGRRDRPNEELLMRSSLPDAQKDMIGSFYGTILHGSQPRHADFAEGHKIVKIVEAILESDRNRSWEKVSS
jgi:predicted dehydrogenase